MCAAAALRKQLYWCLYEYGTGELLLRLRARSAEEITAKYPQLAVLDDDPPWFEPEEASDPDRFPEYDIDAEPEGALKELPSIERAARGKRHYYVEYDDGDRVLGRRIWAESLAQIESRYPQLDAVPIVVAPADAWLSDSSDIDSPDDFLRTLRTRVHGTAG
jgi:hypothetical protein